MILIAIRPESESHSGNPGQHNFEQLTALKTVNFESIRGHLTSVESPEDTFEEQTSLLSSSVLEWGSTISGIFGVTGQEIFTADRSFPVGSAVQFPLLKIMWFRLSLLAFAIPGIIAMSDIDEKFLQEVMTRELAKEGLQVERVKLLKLSPFDTVGTVFGSDRRRAEMEIFFKSGETLKKSLIIVDIPTDERADIINKLGLFEREINMYKHMLPAMDKYLHKFQDDYLRNKMWLKAYDMKEFTRLIIQDVDYLKYYKKNTYEGLDMEHSKIALDALAKFHALGAIMKEKNIVDMKPFDLSVGQKVDRTEWYAKIFQQFAKSIRSHWGAEWEPTAKYFEEKSSTIFHELTEMSKKDVSKFNTILSGYFYIDNMYFKYGSAEHKDPIGLKTMIFQNAFFNSPALDLQMFMNTSPEPELMIDEARRDELVHFYAQKLIEYLKKYGYQKNFTVEDFLLEYRRTELLGLTNAISFLGDLYQRNSDTEVADVYFVESENSKGDFTQKGLTNPAFIKLFFGIDSIQVDSVFLDRVQEAYNSDLPCSRRVVRVNHVDVDKQEDSIYDVSNITLHGELQNGDKWNFSLRALEVAPDGFRRTLAQETGIFDKLYLVHTQVLPKMKDLMKAAGDWSETLFLDSIEAKNGSYLVFRTPGFGWSQPGVELVPGFPDLVMAFRNLAKWHAMGAVLVEKDQIPGKELFAERLPMKRMNQSFTHFLKMLAEVVRSTWGRKWNRLAEQLKDSVPQIDGKIRTIFNRSTEQDAFNVFNFGDFHWPDLWLNYGVSDAYVTEHPIAFKFSSFETSHINTPATDLHHVTYSTLNTKTVLKHKDYLVEEVYYPALVRYLSKFGYGGRPLTLARLKDELRRTELYAILTCIMRVQAEIEAKESDDWAALEKTWTTGEHKTNMNAMHHRRFTDAMKPVMEYAKDRNIFGKGDESGSDEDSNSKSESESD
ncbi:hypothetical protein GE061_017253 [Apolygus lucorum]|uniref:CHK kinase-like domain-containing protein n=1 Tax=Apolygus lucorum TaxID=248454 RepID=A0A8S9XCN8_APOLU|nr:hypothetical protein GE061_017253 [Apolygus lucorum]